MRIRRLFVWAWVSVVTAGAGLLAGAIARSWPWAVAAACAAAPFAWWVATTRDRRRARIEQEGFPESWRRILDEQVAFYRRLGSADRARFEREVRAFLAETVVTGPRGKRLEDDLRVLVAASAIILVFGRPGYRYPLLRDVIVYDDAFDEDYEVHRHGGLLGQVGAQGPLILSARALREGFAAANGGHNVGLHEFAHLLDFEDGAADGIPSLMPWRSVRPWIELMRRETLRAREHRSVLREYAATNQAELFAVATEAFFEQPVELARQHPELYAVLRETYGQDPAAAFGQLAADAPW